VPPPAGGEPPSAPTGQVFNSVSTSFRGDVFIIATEDGTIAAWQPSDGTNAVLRVDNSTQSSVYKGVTLGTSTGKTRLFATDFHNNKVDVFDDDYQPVVLHHGFVDKHLPPGFAPFNVFALGDLVFVSYALQDDAKLDDVKGPGNGFIDAYDFDGA